MKDLSIIIVNYKTPLLTEKCIESIYSTTSKNIHLEIIIVDNASQDNSEQFITSKYSDVKWISNPVNEGFGRANNKGIEIANGNFVLLLNSDLILLNQTIEKALAAIKKHPNPGILGCQPLNIDGSEQNFTSTIASFRKLIDKNLIINYLFPAKNVSQEAVMGSFMLFPKKVLDECGSFDPDFFMYSEEIELCHRIKMKGFDIVMERSITFLHENGGSSSDKTWANRQSYLSSALLFYKIHGVAGYILYHFVNHLNYFINFLLLWKFDKSYRKDFRSDFSNYFSIYAHYFRIPILYSRETGRGKRILEYEVSDKNIRR
ncbi:MAG: glycosyltransferase family 2 protein [Fluviicola sp.]